MSPKDPERGYSGTPLARKIGLKPGMVPWVVAAPFDYGLFFDPPLKPEDWVSMDEVAFLARSSGSGQAFIHAFLRNRDELERLGPGLKSALAPDGVLWVSWPKGSSGIATDLKRDILREAFLDLGLVDVKIAAIDADWSGLKFVYRLKDRQ